ncbi:uncharacterized protein LOC130648800 [Hydractinia symbiolongicarpus]|uniref:uncharacterized protein LOC130648800 n=1 Tax=Hydractinia symbiolongicarpus TaxID=13093 RepID=UPI00254B75C5|nr:uncharacterized protein LOC130648800 [Hydractinia symbiolongicarpus]
MKFRQHIDKHRLLYIIGILIAFSVGNLIGRSFYHTNDVAPSSNSAAQQLYFAYLQQKIIRERREDKRQDKDVDEEEDEEDDNDAEVINQKENGVYVGDEKDKGAPTLSQKDNKAKLDIVTIVNEPEKTHGDAQNKKSETYPVRKKTFDGVDYRDENVEDNTETNGKEGDNAGEMNKKDEMNKEHNIQGREDEPVTNINGKAEDVNKNEERDKNVESESENKGTQSESKNQIHQDRNINTDEVDEKEEEGGKKSKDKHAQTKDTEDESEKNQIHQDKSKNADSMDENEEKGDEKAETEDKGEIAKKKAESEDKNAESRGENVGSEDENADSEDENAESKNEQSESKDENAESKDEQLESKDEKAETEDENTESKEKNEESEDKNEESEDKNEESEDKNEEGEDKNEESKEKNEESEDKNEESEDKNEESKEKNEESEDKNEESEDKNEESEDKNEESEDKNEESEDKNEESKEKNEESEDKNEESEDKNEESEDKNEESKEKNEESEDKNEESEDKNEESEDKNEESEDKNEESEDKNVESETKNQTHQDKSKNAKNVDENEGEDENAENESKHGEIANKNHKNENIKIKDKRKGDENEDSNQDEKISGKTNAENESEQQKYNNKVYLFEHKNKSVHNDEDEMTNIPETKNAKHKKIFFAKHFPDVKMSKPIFEIIRKKNIQAKEREDRREKRVGERYVHKTISANYAIKVETDSPVDNNPVTNKNEADHEKDDEFDVDDEEKNEISYKTISTLSKGYNQAMVLHKKCSRKYKNMKERKKLILITAFTNPQSINLYSARKQTVEKMKARLMEILNTVQKNLNNQMFESVHIFTPTNDDADYLRKIDFSNSHKLILVAVKKTVTVKLILSYVTKCLKNKYVVMTKPDNLFGKGWENLDFNHLKTEKLLYAVTRHSSKTSCRYSKTQAHCDRRNMYRKSNDVIVFYVHGSFSLKNLQKLRNATLYHVGIENTLIWTFKYDLGYTILNPCRVLFVHHEHCVPLHEEYSEFDFDDMTYVWPSKKLF